MGRKSKANRQNRPMPPVVEPPPEFAAAIDRASESDRIWFKQHPGEDERQRLYIEGEFWPQKLTRVDLVVVFQVRPGFRMRYPMIRLTLPETERVQ